MLSIGLDIGGANTKLVAFETRGRSRGKGLGHPRLRGVRCEYFPFWEGLDDFPSFLEDMLAYLLAEPHRLAVTMTAELADCFKTKVEGVQFVLSAVRSIDPSSKVLLNSGDMVPLESGLSRPLEVASANWMAPALLLGGLMKECIFIDVGTTTTDIIPVKNGSPCVREPTDQGRLTNHELVYSGALRTSAANLTDRVMLHERPMSLASEYFASTADVNLLLGLIHQCQYYVPTPDGGEPSAEGARIRLARLICRDGKTMAMEDAVHLASSLHNEQVHQIAAHVMTVMARDGVGSEVPCVTGGIGRNAIGLPAARRAGLNHIVEFHRYLAETMPLKLGEGGEEISHQAPAASLALMTLKERSQCG